MKNFPVHGQNNYLLLKKLKNQNVAHPRFVVICKIQAIASRNISDCSHFLILVSIRTALLTNIKFGEGWSQPSNETQNLVDRSLKTLNFKQTFFVQNNLNYTLVAEYWLRQYKGYFRTKYMVKLKCLLNFIYNISPTVNIVKNVCIIFPP